MISSFSSLFQRENGFRKLSNYFEGYYAALRRHLSESMLLTVLNVLSTFEFYPEIDKTRLGKTSN